MSRTILLAATLGMIGSALVLPVPDANAAFCAKPPKLGVHGGDCQKYQCVRHGPCQVGRLFTRRGCLKYVCTAMVPVGGGLPGKPPGTPPGPIDPGRPPTNQPR